MNSIDDFRKMNRVYAEYFTYNQSERVTVAVALLSKNVSIKDDAIAVVE